MPESETSIQESGERNRPTYVYSPNACKAPVEYGVRSAVEKAAREAHDLIIDWPQGERDFTNQFPDLIRFAKEQEVGVRIGTVDYGPLPEEALEAIASLLVSVAEEKLRKGESLSEEALEPLPTRAKTDVIEVSTDVPTIFSRYDVFGLTTSELVIDTLSRLHQGEPVRAAAIAEEIGKSQATIQKYLREASKQGVVRKAGRGWLPAEG